MGRGVREVRGDVGKCGGGVGIGMGGGVGERMW